MAAPVPDMSSLWLLGGGVFAGLTILIILFGDDKTSVATAKRVARVAGTVTIRKTDKDPSKDHASLRKSTQLSSIPFIDALIKKIMPQPEKLRQRIARTGKTLSLGEYLLINALLVFVFFVILSKMMGMAVPSAIFGGIALGLFLPHAYIGRAGDKRIKKFLASFPEAIDTMCRGLRSGLPVTESIAAVGREMPDPVGIEYRRISDAVRMGRSLDDAMWDVAKRINIPEFRFLIIAMAIQRETGGNLAETLGNLSDLIRRRRQLRLKIRAMSSEARASAMIIGSLPFVMFCILYLVNPDYMTAMLYERKGQIMLGFALGMIGLGAGVMAKMIKFEI
jgi:tight adherence protein B